LQNFVLLTHLLEGTVSDYVWVRFAGGSDCASGGWVHWSTVPFTVDSSFGWWLQYRFM